MLKNIIAGIASVSASYWRSHSTTGRVWLTMGLIALVVDAALCYQYGVTQTTLHGIGFAVVALFFAKLPDGAYEEYHKGNKIAGLFLGLLTIPLGAVAYQSHIGYGAGVRMGDIKQASIQDARYDGAQATAKENAGNLAMWKAQLAKLMENDAWTATVKADALRSEIADLESRIIEEKSGKRGRRAGCGKECERLQDLRTKAVEKLGRVEQREDLTEKIAATMNLVNKYREAAATTNAGMSSVAMQTTANTQLFGVIRAAWTGEKLEDAMKTSEETAKLANLIITAAGSLAFMLMAPIGFFMAGRNRIKGRDDEQSYEPAHDVTPANTFTTPTMARDLTPVITNTNVVDRYHRDPRVTDMLHLLAAAGRRGATA